MGYITIRHLIFKHSIRKFPIMLKAGFLAGATDEFIMGNAARLSAVYPFRGLSAKLHGGFVHKAHVLRIWTDSPGFVAKAQCPDQPSFKLSINRLSFP
jgi:hypothetical protein